MVNCINLIIEMSPRFVLGQENVPCIAEVVNRSLKADRESLGQKAEKMKLLLIILFVVCGVDRYRPVCATYFTVFGFCQTFIFNVTFQGEYFWKSSLLQRKNLLSAPELFSQFCHFWRYFRDKMLSVQLV